MRKSVSAAGLVACLIGLQGGLQSCISDAPSSPLGNAEADWRRSEPDTYAYTVTHVCFCPGGPVEVMANRDSVLSVQALPGGRGILDPSRDKRGYAIDSLIREVRANLDRKHDSHTLHFDKTYGFPDSVFIDFDNHATDEEYGLIISDFRPITE